MAIQAAIPFWQLLSVIAVPTLMIFIGILLNRQDYRSLDTKIGQLHNDIIMVHSILREFEGRRSRLESRPL